MNYWRPIFLLSGILITIMLFFVSCGGSSSGDRTGGSTTLSGIAAAGAPISGKIYVKGINNSAVSVAIVTDGSFSIDVSSLTAPYILCAEGIASGKSVKLFSCAVTAGTINISPVTDLIIRNVLLGENPQTVYDAWESDSRAAQTDIDAATQKVMNQLEPLTEAAEVPSGFNPMRTSFETGSTTGFDKVLDGLTIIYVNSTATVSNNYTNHSFTDDVATSGDDTGAVFPSGEKDATTLVMRDEQEIDAIFQTLTELYATESPSQNELTDFFDTYAAIGFFRSGLNKAETVSNWISDDSPPVGMRLHWVNVRQLTSGELAGTGYSEGYLGRIYYDVPGESNSFLSYAVHDGAKWLWFGDQKWIEYYVEPYERMYVDPWGDADFKTGLAFDLHESSDYAYNQGIRSAVVTGPGLPVDGVVMQHADSGDRFVFRDIGSDGEEWFYILNDNAIAEISDNAEYSITLCKEEAAVLTGINDCSGDDSTTITIPKPPLLQSELVADYFPALTSPSSHALEAAHTGDVLDFAWTNPDNMKVSKADLIFEDADNILRDYDTDALNGVTSAQIDSTNTNPASTWALLHLYGYDSYARQFVMEWDFYFGVQP